MKKLLTLTVLLSITTITFCQDANNETKTISKADYMKKSKTQKIAGWCLAGTGTAILAITLITQAYDEFYIAWDSPYTTYSSTNYTGYYVAGGLVLATGIAFLAASKVNSNKAHALTANLKMENSKQIKNATGFVVNYPAIALRIRL